MKKKEGIHWRIVRLLDWPKYLIPALLIWTALEFLIDPYAGILMLALDVAYVLLVLWWTLSFRKHTTQDLVEFAKDYVRKQKEQMKNLPVPYAILDQDGNPVWMNHSFEYLLPEDSEEDRVLLMKPFLEKNLPQDENRVTAHIHWNDRDYQAELQMITADERLYSLFLFDETEHKEALQRIEDQKAVIGLIYVDNYDEAMSSVEQVRQAMLAALIERKISRYFGNYDSVIRKLEKDKYVIFMSRKGLNAVMEDRFKILEEVKGLNSGNKTAVTLSISMATDGTSLEQIHEFARNAMDLALGRGGDQAIVKTPEFTRYYGGKSQQQEKNTRVKARVKAQALKEIILTRDTVLIMGHKIPDSDAFGAAVGIYRAARIMDKKAHIVMSEIPEGIRPMVTRFQTSPEYPVDMIISAEKAQTKLDGNAVLVVVDVNRPSYTEAPALLDRAATVVVLDHHRQGGETVRRATLSYIEAYASSTSEMVAEILQYFTEQMKLSPLEAEALYAGIVIDTNNFLNKTGVRTFEAAAFLRRCGADVSRVRKLFRDSMEDARAKAKTVSNVEIFRDCFAFSVCPAAGVSNPTVICAQAANEMLDIVGVKASFVLTEHNDQIYISARSIDEINVQLIMERLGGGGHLSVAGAQLKHYTIEEAKRLVQDTIVQMLGEGAI